MRVTAFFTLACMYTWGVLLMGLSQAAGGMSALFTGADISIQDVVPYIYAASFGPTIIAIFMLLTGPSPISALKAWGLSLVRIKAHPVIWLLAVFILPVSALAVIFATGTQPAPNQEPMLVYITVLIAPLNGLFSTFLGAGPLGEEPGWRGYALPRMLERMRPLKTSLVLGAVWTIWHWPMMLIPEWRAGGLPLHAFAPMYSITVVLLAYIMTRLFQWSRGSVLMAIWFHGIANSIMPLMGSGIWDLGEMSAMESGARVIAPLLVASFMIFLFGRTSFAKSREQSWRISLPIERGERDFAENASRPDAVPQGR